MGPNRSSGPPRFMSILREGHVITEAEVRESERFRRCYVAGFEDGGRGMPRNAGAL